MNFFLKNNLTKNIFSSGFALTSGIFWALAVLAVSSTVVYFSQQDNSENLNTNLSINQIPKNNPPQPSLAPREGEEGQPFLESREGEADQSSLAPRERGEDSFNTQEDLSSSQGESLSEETNSSNPASTTIAGIQIETDPIFTLWNKQDGIKIKESQIKDFQDYLTEETDPLFTSWNKSTGISITESQITDLQNYLTQESDPLFSASEANNFIQGDKAKLDSLNNYALPVATTDTLGGIKIGNRLTITNGVLSADIQSGSGLVDAVNGQTGIVLLDPDDLDDATTAHKFVSANQITNWNTAYGWGNHSSAGYLTSISGLNISVLTNDTGYITDGNTNWNNTYGFITSYTETDPVFTAWNKSTGISITESQISDLQTYLTSYTETDPNVSAWAKAGTKPTYTATEIGLGNVPNLTFSGSNTGDETTSTIKTKLGTATTSTDGYLTSTDWNTFNSKQPAGSYLTAETDPIFNIHSASSITSDDITDWTTAHSWGDHSASGYLTSYTETDPTFTSSQANNITASHITILGNTSNTNTGDETTSSIKTKLTVADTDTDGYLSFTDWNIFNSKQPAGSYLTSYSETDPVFSAWNKSTGITIQESQISDLQSYITDGNTNWNNTYGFITDLSTFTTDNLTQGTTNLYSQWATSGATISFSGGNVGIGTTNATAKLTVDGLIKTTADGIEFPDGTTQIVAANNTTYAVGDGRVGDAYCKKKEVSTSGVVGDWVNINNGEICGENKGCDDGACVEGGIWTCGTDQVADSESHLYDTVLIGSQCWMASNLNVGTMISGSSNQTNNSTIEKYCYSNTASYCDTDGGLYQWDEAMQYSTTAGTQGICPTGWHIPTDTEQYTLENYLKDDGQTCSASRSDAWDCSSAGTKLKVGGSSGFEAALAGYRGTDGSFPQSFFGHALLVCL